LAGYLARALVGEIAAVNAIGRDTDPGLKEAGSAGTGVTLLHARRDAVAVVFNSRTCAFGYDQRLEVFGETGMLQARNQTVTSVAASSAARTEALGRIQDHYTRRFAASYRREVEVGFDGLTTVCVFGWHEKADAVNRRMLERLQQELT
jgi:myo-inositol 2-dehydrogenase/D-chiro-inositol 1-dehydrogenase